MIILILLNSIIFLLLALLHFYWASGGKWSRDIAIPVNRKGRKTFRPGIGITLLVAAGLLVFALVTLANSVAFNNLVDIKIIHYGDWAIGIIFLWRSIGDFKYFGFFWFTQINPTIVKPCWCF